MTSDLHTITPVNSAQQYSDVFIFPTVNIHSSFAEISHMERARENNFVISFKKSADNVFIPP